MQHRPHQLPDGSFQNLSDTPQLAPGVSMPGMFRKFLFGKRPATPQQIPSLRTDLKNWYTDSPAIFWFGHSSYLIHCRGVNVLVDPVFSGYASPVSMFAKAFPGSNVYQPQDMPDIDLLIITHNHYDHLDTKTVKKLAPKIKQVVTPLKVAADIRPFVKNDTNILEMDWWQSTTLRESIEIISTPARHFSGRGLKRNQSLWSSFVLRIFGHTIFIGSDSGNDDHFKEIGKKYGPMDIALLECGQYNEAWPYIHSFPEDLITEAKDLQTLITMPVHWAKFTLGFHAWDEPVKRFVKAADAAGLTYTTPMIGEPVVLGKPLPKRTWWQDVK